MNNDEFVNQIKSMVGNVKAEAYKAGFTDGINFIKASLHLKEPTKLEDFWEDEEL